MKRVFAEIGFGNGTFFSTEFEEGDGEYRVPRFVLPQKFKSIYFRFWIGTRVYVLSSSDGFETKTKDRSKLKILFGISGETS